MAAPSPSDLYRWPPHPARRVTVAGALSLAIHLLIFGALALFSGNQAWVPPELLEEMLPEEPLVFEVEATLAPEPERVPVETVALPSLPAATPPPRAQGAEPLRTELDPRNLQRSETAPERPTMVAAHHSRASAPAAATPAPTPSPQEEGENAQSIAASPVPTPAPTPGEEEGIGVDAIGDWKKAVGNSIGARWNAFRESKLGLLEAGSVRIKFAIDGKGGVSNVKVLTPNAAKANTDYAIRAIREAEIPPIPPERLARAPGGRIEIEFTFTIFANQ